MGIMSWPNRTTADSLAPPEEHPDAIAPQKGV
jgi:hypothetical protein